VLVSQVEARFENVARIWHLHLASGQVIRTTAEHPFYVDGRGWVAAGELQPGDLLVSHDGQRVAVAELYDTGTYERVYNLAIRSFHTYFVCDETWPFSVWAHNACDMHHPAFKYILRGINKYLNGTSSLRGLSQNLVKIGRRLHQQLHRAFDEAFSDFARRHGWKNIYKLLDGGKTTPTQLFNAMEEITRQVLHGHRALQPTLNELQRIRTVLGIP
jgi:hypothetical protein